MTIIEMVEQIEQGCKFTFGKNNNVYTLDTFKTTFMGGKEDKTMQIIELLCKKGEIKPMINNQTEAEILRKALEEESITEMANILENEEEQRKDYVAEKARENKLTYEEIKVNFPTYAAAYKAQMYFAETLRLKQMKIEPGTSGQPSILIVNNATDKDLNAINKYYTSVKVMGAITDIAEKITDGATRSLDTVAKEVVAPITQIGAKTGVSVAKTTTMLAAKTGAVIVSSVVKGAEDLKSDFTTDEDIIKASRDLIGFKDMIKRKFGFNKGINSGIEIK